MQGEMYCWIVFLDKDPKDEEFNLVYGLMDERGKREFQAIEEREANLTSRKYLQFSAMVTRLLPMWMLRNRGVLRGSWVIGETESGKPYVASPVLAPAMAFGVSHMMNCAGIVFAEVANTVPERIGLDIMLTLPKGEMTGMGGWFTTYSHMLTPLERSFVVAQPEHVGFRRIMVLKCMKDAYRIAVGISVAKFNYASIECDPPRSTVRVDGQPLYGWEFRLFKASVGSAARNGRMEPEEYQIACALYHGPTGVPPKVSFGEEYIKMDQWIKFINVDGVLQFVREMYKEDPVQRKAKARAAAMPDVHGPQAMARAANFVQGQGGHAGHR